MSDKDASLRETSRYRRTGSFYESELEARIAELEARLYEPCTCLGYSRAPAEGPCPKCGDTKRLDRIAELEAEVASMQSDLDTRAFTIQEQHRIVGEALQRIAESDALRAENERLKARVDHLMYYSDNGVLIAQTRRAVLEEVRAWTQARHNLAERQKLTTRDVIRSTEIRTEQALCTDLHGFLDELEGKE